jgi:hypothetical protein
MTADPTVTVAQTSNSNRQQQACQALSAAIVPCVTINSALFFFVNEFWLNTALLTQIALWNLAAILCFVVIRLYILQPLRHIGESLMTLRATYATEHRAPHPSLSVCSLAREVSQFSHFAAEYYKKHGEVSKELAEARRAIAHFSLQQQVLLNSTQREGNSQYQSVLAYANYLEERVMANHADPTLRYDFDDVCESSFSLSLMASAMAMLNQPGAITNEDVPLASLLQQTLIKLAPALDRRSMRLSSASVDMSVVARGDAKLLMHVVWMMLFGIIRYAQDESTLRLRTLTSHDGSKAILSIVISELSPSTLSENERASFLERQTHYQAPHLFADAVREHGNVQLASLLLANTHGTVRVEPLTASACELSLTLPTTD